MAQTFATRLAQLQGRTCEGVRAVEYEQPANNASESVGITVPFSDGTLLHAQYWRLIKEGRPLVSNFDHGQQYGLPAPIDAVHLAHDEASGKRVMDASMDQTTGDLYFRFVGGLVLQVFNFTGYEIWEVKFADGSGEFSNYALANEAKPS